MVCYGLQKFFFVPNADRTMKNIILNYHIFKLDDIIKEYESHLIKPDPVIECNDRETQESIQAWFHVYDAYEPFSRALSRLIIEYLLLTFSWSYQDTDISLWALWRFSWSILLHDGSILLQYFWYNWHWRCIKGFLEPRTSALNRKRPSPVTRTRVVWFCQVLIASHQFYRTEPQGQLRGAPSSTPPQTHTKAKYHQPHRAVTHQERRAPEPPSGSGLFASAA